MKRIQWSNSLSLGVKQVDDQHKRLIQLANNLISAIRTDVADDILGTVFNELREYSIFHFRDEELLMKDIGYPGLSEHMKQHEEFRERVARYESDFTGNNRISPSELMEFLGDWLINHIATSDMQIAKFIRTQRVEQDNMH